ncbi:hypothetical protein DWW33_07135 [Roseburia sp. AF15-21]|nr:hypothetical protein DXB43_11995 [Roseburia sp. OM04-10BH]RHR87683.1 hypothetical protein DWW33_07135 [Roseburia sp. AF15-21]RHV38522.1 hypothetical protein DXB49_11635 [Roseburia sp. OM04-15AA]RHV57317.1 hypothetical protein DXB42_09835 [Roseburia sp. OM04-10AA]
MKSIHPAFLPTAWFLLFLILLFLILLLLILLLLILLLFQILPPQFLLPFPHLSSEYCTDS